MSFPLSRWSLAPNPSQGPSLSNLSLSSIRRAALGGHAAARPRATAQLAAATRRAHGGAAATYPAEHGEELPVRARSLDCASSLCSMRRLPSGRGQREPSSPCSVAHLAAARVVTTKKKPARCQRALVAFAGSKEDAGRRPVAFPKGVVVACNREAQQSTLLRREKHSHGT